MESRRLVEHSVATLKPYVRKVRFHSKKQIKQIAGSIESFGLSIDAVSETEIGSNRGP